MTEQAHPSISVCISVYNAAPYLRECIDSILSQSFRDFELLIVDDGSEDNSCEIVTSYADRRIRLIRNKHDYIDSLNLSLREAKGRYIARMDADDRMRPGRLEAQYTYMENHPDVDIVGAGMQCFGQASHTLKPAYTGEIGCLELIEGCCFYHPTALMRKQRLEETGMAYRPDAVYAEDYAFWVDATLKGLTIVNTEDIFLDYRVGPQQVSVTKHSIQRQHAFTIKKRLMDWWFTFVEGYLNEPPRAVSSSNALTIVIPFYNEGTELLRTVTSIRDTAGDKVDIVAVNDKSDDGIDYTEMLSGMNVTLINNPRRMGPAMAKEKGVQCCATPYFLLLDAHMRFYQSDWADILIEELRKDGHQLLCCQTKALKLKNGEEKTEKTTQTFGAYIYWGMKHYTPTALWNTNPHAKTLCTGHIPCVLGACYASSKVYWNKLKGYRGLLYYGCEEPFISIKAWYEGGKCRFMPQIVTGHVYKDYSVTSLLNAKYLYNYLLIAHLLLPTSHRCKVEAVLHTLNASYYNAASLMLKMNEDYLSALKKTLDSVLTNKDFDHIKSINYVLSPEKEDILREKLTMVPDIMDTCNARKLPASHIGLYCGRTGLAILYLLYFRQSHEIKWKHKALFLINEIIIFLTEHKDCPISFANGTAGVGWGLTYLADNGLLTYDRLEAVLETIDISMGTLSPQRMKDLSLDTGITGITAYCTARIGYCKRHGVKHRLPADFIDELATASRRNLKEHATVSDPYHYSLHKLMSQYGLPDWETTKTDFSDILPLPTALGKNPKYWDCNLTTGCTGYAIHLLITQHKNHEN